MGKGKAGRIRRKGSGHFHLFVPYSTPTMWSSHNSLWTTSHVPSSGYPQGSSSSSFPSLGDSCLSLGPESISITSCERHLLYHLVSDRYPIIPLDSILFFSVYQSYSIQISLWIYTYNVIFLIDNTVHKGGPLVFLLLLCSTWHNAWPSTW